MGGPKFGTSSSVRLESIQNLRESYDSAMVPTEQPLPKVTGDTKLKHPKLVPWARLPVTD